MKTVFGYLKNCHAKDGAELFTVVPEQIKNKWAYIAMKQSSVDQQTGKKIQIVAAVQQWNRPGQEVMNSPSLKVFK